MSGRRRLLCSLPIVAVVLAVIGCASMASASPVRPDAPDAPDALIDVKKPSDPSTALLTEEATSDSQSWTILWDDLGVKDGDAPVVSGGGSATHGQASASLPSGAPPIIAAPLPPAIVSGIIGLVGVYAYKRRNRLH
jgi:hypothetical protein